MRGVCISKNVLRQLAATLAASEFGLVNAQYQLRQNTLMLKQISELATGYSFVVVVRNNIVIPQDVSALQTVVDSAWQNRLEVEIGANTIRPSISDCSLSKNMRFCRASLSSKSSILCRSTFSHLQQYGAALLRAEDRNGSSIG